MMPAEPARLPKPAQEEIKVSFVRRAIRYPYNYVMRRAPWRIKRVLWDREYRSGKWDFADHTAGDCVYRFLHRYVAQGRLLDLGCGTGNTATEIAEPSYSSYVGVDISDVALAKAASRSAAAGRAAKNRFVNADFLQYTTAEKFDVILMRESIYLVSVRQVRELLERSSAFLSGTGVFIVRLVTDNRISTKARVRIIERHFDVIEREEQGPRGLTILVFRPKSATVAA